MESKKLKACISNYFRYKKQCIVLAFEAFNSDVIAMTEAGTLYEAEVKISLSDLYHDQQKRKHHFYREGFATRYPWRMDPHYFYFAVPVALANKVCFICDSKYPYAGVLGVPDDNTPSVTVYRKAKRLNGVKLTQEQINSVMKQQSGTLCRMAMELAEIKYY